MTKQLSAKTIDIVGCARCDGEGHDGLTFEAFTSPVPSPNPNAPYTYWAMCPNVDEPILMQVFESPR